MSNKRASRLFASCMAVSITAGLAAPEAARAQGLRLIGHSMEAQSRGEAVIAGGRGAANMWYNPAGMAGCGPLDAAVGVNHLNNTAANTDRQGREEKSAKKNFVMPHAYVASDFGTENFAAGIGVNVPFGLGTEYDKNSAFRYITTGGEVNLLNINPSVAYKFSGAPLRVGAGLQYFRSTAELGKQYPWAAVPGLPAGTPDGSVKVEGEGSGVGFNLGLQYDLSDKRTIGLTYRSQVVVNYDGEQATLTDIPAAPLLQAAFGTTSGTYRTGAKTGLRFPDVAAVGYSHRVSDVWLWEAAFEWINWNDFRAVDIQLDQPVAGLLPNESLPLHWRNGWDVRLGAERKLSENIAVSGGYTFDKSPVRESTYLPLIPDGDRHIFSLGYRQSVKKGFDVRLPVFIILQPGPDGVDSDYTDATLTQNVDGDYEIFAVQIGLGITYAFGG